MLTLNLNERTADIQTQQVVDQHSNSSYSSLNLDSSDSKKIMNSFSSAPLFYNFPAEKHRHPQCLMNLISSFTDERTNDYNNFPYEHFNQKEISWALETLFGKFAPYSKDRKIIEMKIIKRLTSPRMSEGKTLSKTTIESRELNILREINNCFYSQQNFGPRKIIKGPFGVKSNGNNSKQKRKVKEKSKRKGKKKDNKIISANNEKNIIEVEHDNNSNPQNQHQSQRKLIWKLYRGGFSLSSVIYYLVSINVTIAELRFYLDNNIAININTLHCDEDGRKCETNILHLILDSFMISPQQPSLKEGVISWLILKTGVDFTLTTEFLCFNNDPDQYLTIVPLSPLERLNTLISLITSGSLGNGSNISSDYEKFYLRVFKEMKDAINEYFSTIYLFFDNIATNVLMPRDLITMIVDYVSNSSHHLFEDGCHFS